MIAGIVLIGDPKLYGYGNVLAECLQSFDDFCDLVILVQSHKAFDYLQSYVRPLTNTQVISNKSTWFKDGYDGKQLDRNIDIGMNFAQEQGAKIAIVLSSNWYIPERSRTALRDTCETCDGWDYLYRGDQLAGQLFSASKRLPMIIQIGSEYHYKFSSDGLENEYKKIPTRRGDFSSHNDSMIIDVPFEITLDDLEGKLNFVRCYHDELVKRDPVFSWDFWNSYYIAKFKDKRHTNMQLDEYGARIAANTKPEYLSHLFLREIDYATP